MLTNVSEELAVCLYSCTLKMEAASSELRNQLLKGEIGQQESVS
jgi:hypothetical protein